MRKLENETIKNPLTPEQQEELIRAIDKHIRIPTYEKIQPALTAKIRSSGHEKFTPKIRKPTRVPLRHDWLPSLEICGHQILMMEYNNDPKAIHREIFVCPQEQWKNFLTNITEEQKTEWLPFLQILTISPEGELYMSFQKNTDQLAIVPMAPYSFEIIPAQWLILTPERRQELEEAMEALSPWFDKFTAQTPAEASQSHPETQPPSQTPCSKPPNPFLPQESG